MQAGQFTRSVHTMLRKQYFSETGYPMSILQAGVLLKLLISN